MYYISKCTKKCPNCQIPIQKIDACNKMICTRCGIFFCWMCVQKIEGYSHFQEFPECGDILAAQIEETLEDAIGKEFDEFKLTLADYEDKAYREALKDFIRCPQC